jgi:hypothetical protein
LLPFAVDCTVIGTQLSCVAIGHVIETEFVVTLLLTDAVVPHVEEAARCALISCQAITLVKHALIDKAFRVTDSIPGKWVVAVTLATCRLAVTVPVVPLTGLVIALVLTVAVALDPF